MGYEIKRIDNDDLADYAFQINGALALKNYTATVEGSRLRIAHTQNAALSILECEVSEVEIDGRVYDNPADAQRALESIVYSDLPILVLTREERDRFLELDSVKLEKTSFESFKTENTEALNQKVDKEEGKGLSANDFTNVYKEVLDNLPVE
ncbi:hypothetical protein ACQ1PV_10640, partial [Ornithobacterium rhinotracheale]